MNGWGSLLIGLACLAPFTIQVVVFVRGQLRQRRWAGTTAHIVATRVTRRTIREPSLYIATYAYLDGESRSRFGHAGIDRQLPQGADLPIVYDPDNPRNSQPVTRFGIRHVLTGAVGLLFLLVGIYGTVNGVLLLTSGRGIE